jgi:starvation-inducible outer membrane lipoprotein
MMRAGVAGDRSGLIDLDIPRTMAVRGSRVSPRARGQRMRHIFFVTGWLLPVFMGSCTASVFPYKALDGVNADFDVSTWQTKPDTGPRQKVQLGGRIVRSYTQDDTLAIVTANLPIAQNPADGPQEGKSRGEFVILYRAVVDPLFLREGNRLMVIGQTGPPMNVDVDHTVRSLPTVTALCIHFWNAGGQEIVMRGSSSSGTKVLSELTYCKNAL